MMRKSSIAWDAGASVPFLRPATLADDFQGTIPVIIHALEWLRDNRAIPEISVAVCNEPFALPRFTICKRRLRQSGSPLCV